MIKPNWNIFKAKFSENREKNFEWFCYLLFCKEYNQPHGIFRYINQSGIETNPIKIGDEFIAWEAKFYEDKLSNHKDEFIRKIDIIKSKNPEIKKLIIYTPIDWTESSKKNRRTTDQKNDIEKYAKSKDIEIIWKGASFFESEFVTFQNEIISKHFFSLDNSVFNLIKDRKKHSENVLFEIQTFITFNDQNIEIDRSNELAQLIDKESPKVLILSGTGGVGKTAIIKNLYNQLKENIPFYIFKATEFELASVNDLFRGINLQDFIAVHKDADKIVVIDSAEKLLDLKNTDTFKEFLLILIQNDWKIIFTTRDNYLEDLNYQFFEIYNVVPLNINITNIGIEELNTLSDKYKFLLPKDEKLLELLKNPFYLNEYLKFYKVDEEIDYVGFKEKLWNKIIKKTKAAREQCFLKIAFARANEGQFFINPSHAPQNLVDELKNDGILGYESPHGYFITHDIYEEWALEKNIESEFIKKSNTQEFFKRIGQSLPIRRSYRNWLSEKLLLGHLSIKDFIDEVIKDNKIESHWKDATLIAVLLSDYSDIFFELSKENLKENNYELLKRITFLLRIACKDVDDDFFKQLGIKNINLLSMKYVLTKPKGKGWQSLVKFVFEYLDEIGIKNIIFVLPIIHDWNNKFKEGATTRYSSLIALQYYQWTIKEHVYFDRDGTKDNLLQTILYGSSEIKNELEAIFKDILKNKWKNHRNPYYDLAKVILSKFQGIAVSQVLPNYVLQLADLFWSYTPAEDNRYNELRMEVENYFGIEDDHGQYFPASAYQTPTYWLLQSALAETIDFILAFTNKSVECFAKSDMAKHEVEEIEVFIEKDKSIKQYISNRLWCTYRGTQVSPHILESMHMALEKFILERGKNTDSKALEYLLLYLLINSKSASISAVVVSIVLAYPEKTFNVAKILFQTKAFFLYDTTRFTLDLQQKSSLLMLRNGFGSNYNKEIHEDERLKACDDKHRGNSLENVAVFYQFFRSEEVNEEEADKRQKIIWDIFDIYYEILPDKSKETESDKIWRLYLARMDRRKMKPTSEQKDGKVIINFNPEIDPELKKYSEMSLEKSSAYMKYSSLKLWASYKLQNDDKYKAYEQYEKNPQLALKEVQDIISELDMLKNNTRHAHQYNADNSFYLFNHSIPADVCAVLVRDHFQQLLKEDKNFCKDIILEVAYSCFLPDYQYQISDGTLSAISVLPILLKEFPEEKEDIKLILLLTLFNDYPVDAVSTTFSKFSVMATNQLWSSNPNDAESIFFGFLLLKSKYEKLRRTLFNENHKKGIYKLHENQIIEIFLKENEIIVKKVVENTISKDDLEDITELDLNILRTAFLLIPPKTDNNVYKEIVKKIIYAFAKIILSRDREDEIDYSVRHDFLKKYSYFVLNAPKEEIPEYLKPFLDGFNGSEAIADLFEEFIAIEDRFNLYENFWEVWNLFKNKVIELCIKGDKSWYVAKIVKSYLFAQTKGEEETTEWHTLKDENKVFFKEISEELGHCPSALYAISKLLNDIGALYLNDGISWLSNIISKNLLVAELETDTVYYLENAARKYIYKNREIVRKTRKSKEEVLVILNFLIEKGSVVGYILRENIL